MDPAGELDWVCRSLAFRAFLDAGLQPAVSLFVNVERDSLITPCPEQLLPTIWEAEQRLRVFVDIDGRSVSRYPREVLDTVRHVRAARWGVAVNDLEVGSAAVSLLPVLEPDVVRLNHRGQAAGMRQGRRALFAALAEAEGNDASLVMEQVEDAVSRDSALASGIRYLQGYLLGRPGALPGALPTPEAPLRLLAPETPSGTPFDLAAGHGVRAPVSVPTRRLRRLIGDFVGFVETASYPLFLGVVPPDLPITAEVTMTASTMADQAVLHLTLGRQASIFDDWSVRTANLPDGHPLLQEACFLALSPNNALLLAFQHTGTGPVTGQSTWHVRISQDPGTCRRAVRSLLAMADTLEGGVLEGT